LRRRLSAEFEIKELGSWNIFLAYK
jgi:hypothetical protein